jgi:hypothetical protein
MILALMIQQPTILENKMKDKWEVTAMIPAFMGKDPVSRLAKQAVTTKMTKDFNEFMKEVKKDWVPGYESAPYGFDSGAVRQLGETTAQSYTVSTYRFLGGAHGVGVVECMNFALVNGKATQLQIWDIFRKDKRVQLEKTILAKAKKNPMTDWLQDPEMNKKLEPSELANFWVKGKDGCVWEFDPYVLGSYASGPFTFDFSWKELKPFLRSPNPLKKFINP